MDKREKAAALLLNAISTGESGAWGYNAMNQGTRKNKIVNPGASKDVIGIDLTGLTVDQVMWLQDQKKAFAVGKYQVIPDTLKEMVKRGVISKDDPFDAATQDKLGTALIIEKRPKAIEALENGDIIKAQNELAKEWASIPVASNIKTARGVIKQGQSYYGGANKAHKELSAQLPSILKQARDILVTDTGDESERLLRRNPTPQTFAQSDDPFIRMAQQSTETASDAPVEGVGNLELTEAEKKARQAELDAALASQERKWWENPLTDWMYGLR